MLPQIESPELSIVIVSYNCRDLLLGCLSSIEANIGRQNVKGHEVIVVDSASKDGTAEAVRREHPGVRLFPFDKNVGFVAGNNVAFGEARGKYVLMLNPDTLLSEDALDAMLNFMRRSPRCAAVGPRLLGADGLDQNSAQRFPSLQGELKKTLGRFYPGTAPSLEDYQTCMQFGVAFKADWVSGACILIRGDALREIGGLEKRFFMYFEEVDWCRRAAQAGWEVWCLPRCSIIHFGSQSALASKEQVVGGNVVRHFQRSRYIYFKKHFGLPAAYLVELCHFARVCVRWAKSFGCKTPEESRTRRASACAEMRGELSVMFGLVRS